MKQQIIRFAAVGLLCTFINYASFYVLLNFIGVHYIASSAIGYLLGLALNYFLNLKWTFTYQGATKRTVIKYFALYMFSLAIGLMILKFFVVIMGIIPEISNLLVIGFTMVINFCGIKFWVFKS